MARSLPSGFLSDISRLMAHHPSDMHWLLHNPFHLGQIPQTCASLRQERQGPVNVPRALRCFALHPCTYGAHYLETRHIHNFEVFTTPLTGRILRPLTNLYGAVLFEISARSALRGLTANKPNSVETQQAQRGVPSRWACSLYNHSEFKTTPSSSSSLVDLRSRSHGDVADLGLRHSLCRMEPKCISGQSIGLVNPLWLWQ
ncbi:hypothetical protein BDP55DRAFT_192787 [Colletotrichum godetiae]|uniref:Uncharacterized protein n=1 Tax=Colletotrichum godetiae TaxID=1209918 RepID=A0AAJ0AK20_9PEZI|nr:uncharacterized protein BDP55DRAFT_192787 [Colletotrichum godetiae]KAK1673858.1 hypothetical protein BDP55DRAFT_192787 [Colletotrichum godetiae]